MTAYIFSRHVDGYPVHHVHSVYSKGIDMLIVDEAHSLKNGKAQATVALEELPARYELRCRCGWLILQPIDSRVETLLPRPLHPPHPRVRLLLTGTPIQNDLKEFFTLMNLAVPGLLGEVCGCRLTWWNLLSTATG